MFFLSARDNLRKQVSGFALFLALSCLGLLLLLTLLRLSLHLTNLDQSSTATWSDLMTAYFNGLRFDSRIIAYTAFPLLPFIVLQHRSWHRPAQVGYLAAAASFFILLGLIEPIFYREFHQRLNSLAFQYLSEDPATVLRMLWHGFPLLRLLLVWVLLSWTLVMALRWLSKKIPPKEPTTGHSRRWLLLLAALLVAILAARGTLRQGPPLRWGDAFTTQSVFANQLGLNPEQTLYTAIVGRLARRKPPLWKNSMAATEAIRIVRQSLLLPQETLVDAEQAVVRRVYQPRSDGQLPVRNVVVILMESLAARYVGALGDSHNITPCFDELSKKGLLFRNFLANGTHTHQGLFATMTSFPNLPGYEYLMQMSEGSHEFSGLASLLKPLGYKDLYVYNGDFAWDNQSGFFGHQGFQNFIGRNDYVNPVVSDSTWGVSDQDMFDRAARELARLSREKKPFFALLQTLSNHTPYALPDPLPVPPVTTMGSLNEHLTAMRYADWALGRFFDAIEEHPFFRETLFVVVGDHGFANSEQLTELDLNRFHVPLLLLAPGIQECFGSFCDRVGSQVDIVPTILGRLGHSVQHQCWGRDLLALPSQDAGFAVIKPSGSDQTVGLLQGNQLLIWPQGRPAMNYQIDLLKHQASIRSLKSDEFRQAAIFLQAYIESATRSLRQNSAGAISSQEKTL